MLFFAKLVRKPVIFLYFGASLTIRERNHCQARSLDTSKAPATKKPLFVADSPKNPCLATKMADFVAESQMYFIYLHDVKENIN